jgi:undecaprenyl diphosphate synthase
MNIPRHIAIIMDGNGRWAKERNLPKLMGYRAGVNSVRTVTGECAKRGIQALTLYSFSTENWKRPKEEVDYLMLLLHESIQKEWAELHKNNIRFNVIGDVQALPESLARELSKVMDTTKNNTGMVLTLALNYGARQEIVRAARALCAKAASGEINIDSFGTEDFERFLYTNNLPELDLVIRTSGEMRLSNFLLWQAAYAEIYVTDVCWPDFGAGEIAKALEEYSKRDRRFGG